MNLRHASCKAIVLAVLAAFLGLPRLAWAQNENETVGFQANHIFEHGQFGESIDVMTGALDLKVPIGPRYQVNSVLGYQVNLTYSSKSWDTTNYQSDVITDQSLQATPSLEGPLGVGFTLSFGRIYIDSRYIESCTIGDYDSCWTHTYFWVAPDGSQHEFYHDDGLHDTALIDYEANHGASKNISGVVSFNKRLTTDGSFVRVTGPANAYCYPKDVTGANKCFLVETPDGLVYTLSKRVDCSYPDHLGNTVLQPETQSKDHSFCGWYTTLIEDRSVGTPSEVYHVDQDEHLVDEGLAFPNNVQIYYDNRNQFEHAIWQIVDSTGRVISFTNCEWNQGANGLPYGDIRDNMCKGAPSGSVNRHAVVTRSIDLPSFGTARTTYYFYYELVALNVPIISVHPSGSTHWSVAKLVRLDYPEVTRVSGGTDNFSIYYDSFNTGPSRCSSDGRLCTDPAPGEDQQCGTGSNCEPSIYNGDYGEVTCRTLPIPRMPGNACRQAGAATGVTRYRYTYDFYEYVQAWLSGGHAPKHIDCAATQPHAGNSVCDGPPSGNGLSGPGGQASTGFTRGIVYKSLELTAPTTAGTWIYDRGISTTFTNPLAVVERDPVGNDTAFYYRGSQTTHGGPITGSDPEDGAAPEWNDGTLYRTDYYEGSQSTGRLVRSELNDYESERSYKYTNQRAKINVRIQADHTQHVDDGGAEVTTSRSDWDNDVGRYRNEVVTGFGLTPPRVTRTEWSEGSDTIYKPIVLLSEVSDGVGVVARTDNQYDAKAKLTQSIERAVLPSTTGTPWSANAVAGDRVTTYGYGVSSGNVVSKTITTNSGDIGYSIAYTYAPSTAGCPDCGGYLSSKKFLNGASGPWFSIDRSRDGNTGLVYEARDTSGIPTDYVYDELGRVTEVHPQGEDPVNVNYVSLAETTVTRGSGSDFTFARYRYDTLGRLVATQNRPADPSVYSCKKKEYDILDRLIYETEWLFEAPDACQGPVNHLLEIGTTYNYLDPVTGHSDPFGRVRKVVPAEYQSIADKSTTTVYFGTSSQVSVHGINGADNVLFTATTTYFRDALGRLQAVDAPPGGADAEYSYDQAGRLIEVDLKDNLGNPTLHQYRRLGYDGLGQLSWSENPENGTISYLSYDALGNPLKIQDAAGNLQRYVYDFAGRPSSKYMTPMGGTEFHAWMQSYDEAGHGVSLGKITTKRSYTEGGNSPIQTQSFTYSGVGGRLSLQTHSFLDWLVASERTNYEYNSRGELSRVTYPQDYPTTSRSLLSVSFGYSNGSLVTATEDGIGTVLGHLYYNAAGGIERVETPGGGRTVIDPDLRNRPGRITIGQFGATDWTRPPDYDSGQYLYDGAGNVTQIGSNLYGYDGLGRLRSSLSFYDSFTSYTESFLYDMFGNIVQTGRSTVAGSTNTEQENYDYGADLTNQILHRHTTINTNQAAPVDFLYDPNGNLIRDGRRVQAVAGGPIISDSKLYDYDTQNRLVRVQQTAASGSSETATEIARYEYDLDGSRVSKLDVDGLKTYYVRDASGQVLSEFRKPFGVGGAAEWSADYIYLGGRLLAMKENLKPSAPRKLRGATTASGSGNKITLTWNENPEQDRASYKIYRKRNGETVFTQVGTIGAGLAETISYQDSTVHSTGLIIYYNVTAVDTIGYESNPSRTLKVMAGDSSRPSAPIITVIAGGNAEVSLSWTTSTDDSDILGYEVYRGNSASNGSDDIAPLVLLTPGLVRTAQFTDEDVANETTYFYRVRAIDGVGNGGYYSCRSGNPPCSVSVTPHDNVPPVEPRHVTAASTCGSIGVPETIELTWDPNPGRAPYLIRYDIYRSGTPVFTGMNPIGRSTSATFRDPGLAAGVPLTPGVQYFYAVKALHVVPGTDPEEVVTSSVFSSPVSATPRDSALTPQVQLFAQGADASVTLSWAPEPTLPWPTDTPDSIFIYRRLNALRSCSDYVRIGQVSGIWVGTYPDLTAPNNAAYDYAISISHGGRESSLSRPTLGIPLAKPRNLFQCSSSGSLLQWTAPNAIPYQPIYAGTSDGPLAYLKGYHVYHHKRCDDPLNGIFRDNSPLRRVVVNSDNTYDPYLTRKDSGVGAELLDPKYTITSSTPFSPALDANIHNTDPWNNCGGASNGLNCVIPRAVYKVYAEGTWLTLESDWPDYFHPLDGLPSQRCDWGYQLDDSPPPCEDETNFSGFVAPPSRVTAQAAGSGAVSLSWTAPNIPDGHPSIAGYAVYARPKVALTGGSADRSFVSPTMPVATLGPGEHSVIVDDLWNGAFYRNIGANTFIPNQYEFRVATIDEAGHVSSEAERCVKTGRACVAQGSCDASFCSTGGSCTSDAQCSYGVCNVSGVSCSSAGTCAYAVCTPAPYNPCTPVQQVAGNYRSTTSPSTTIDTGFSGQVRNGDSLVAIIGTNGSSNNRVAAITQTGVTWQRIDQKSNTAGVTVEIWFAGNVSGADKNVSVMLAQPLMAQVMVAEYSGILTTTPVDAKAEQSGSSDVVTVGPTTSSTSQDSEIWVAGLISKGNRIFTSISNDFAPREIPLGDATGVSAVLLDRVVTSADVASVSANMDQTADWVGVLVTFKAMTPESTQCNGGDCRVQSCQRDTCGPEPCSPAVNRWCKNNTAKECTMSDDCEPLWSSGRHCSVTTSVTTCSLSPNSGCPTGEVCIGGDECVNAPLWVSAPAGNEQTSPSAPSAVRRVVWTLGDRVLGSDDPVINKDGRDGIKLAWLSGRREDNSSVLGFRVYRSETSLGKVCALVDTGTRTVPLPPSVLACQSDVAGHTVDQDAMSPDYSTSFTNTDNGYALTYGYWDRTAAKGKAYFYRVTQVQAGGSGMETPLDQVPVVSGVVLDYDQDVLPPPQGFQAWAPQPDAIIQDQQGMALAWCPVPSASDTPNSDLPSLQYYKVYRTNQKDGKYRLLAKIDPSCLSANNRCEITPQKACTEQSFEQDDIPTCTPIMPAIGCGGAGQGRCGVVDLTFSVKGNCWPSLYLSSTEQHQHDYRYLVTAVGTANGNTTESMPSVENRGWLNYCASITSDGAGNVTTHTCTPDSICSHRRDPEGDGVALICGNEDAALQLKQFSPDPHPGLEYLCSQSSAEPSGYEVVGLPPVCEDCEGGDPPPPPPNPYNPPARFLFYHLDHLGSPRVILDAAGTRVSRHHYLPFGDERPVETDQTLSDRGFTGHQRDDETGLDYMMARYYSSSHGRFMAVDKGGDADPQNPQTWNKYAYVHNNPLSNIDPDGKNSYQCVRPLLVNDSRNPVGHMFDVSGAPAPGVVSSETKFFSYGMTTWDAMGRITPTSGEGWKSAGTATTDMIAFEAAGTPGATIVCSEIPASDEAVSTSGAAVMPDRPYTLLGGGTFGLNSNAGAQAVSEDATQACVEPPGDKWTPGAGSASSVHFDKDRNGQPDPGPQTAPK